ncbi:hypothetical protein ACU4GD_10185 [Cupriavidus basilensis]
MPTVSELVSTQRRDPQLALWHRRAARHRPADRRAACTTRSASPCNSPADVAELARYDQEPTYLDTARYEAYLQRAWEAERRFAERVGTAQPKEHL